MAKSSDPGDTVAWRAQLAGAIGEINGTQSAILREAKEGRDDHIRIFERLDKQGNRLTALETAKQAEKEAEEKLPCAVRDKSVAWPLAALLAIGRVVKWIFCKS